nr:AAA family ATPase [Desulfuribacillus alkaliarsenatis]
MRHTSVYEKGMKTILTQYELGKISLTDTMRYINKENTNVVSNNDINNKSIRELFQELNQLVGLYEVKKLVSEIYAYLQIQRQRNKQGLLTDSIVLHMIFKGNPGTGKTTVARVLGRLFNELNILSKGHMIEVERADLVGEYIGHTAQKTREQIKKAQGGILFIDEAYSLNRGGEKDFGKEAIDTLVKAMEDYKNDFILILAGYSNEIENFLLVNPGLPSRFPLKIEFPDYSIQELVEIAELMLEERQYKLNKLAKSKLQNQLITYKKNNFHNFSNARLIRNIIERAIRKQAIRLFKKTNDNASFLGRSDLITISESDIEIHEEGS